MDEDGVWVAGQHVGGTVTPPRTGMFMHIGGPYDGTEMPVEVDDDGNPPEFRMANDFTDFNAAIPAFAGHQANLVKNTYEREDRLGADGFEYVYVFRGSDTINQNRRSAA
jgi:hypothetical protein